MKTKFLLNILSNITKQYLANNSLMLNKNSTQVKNLTIKIVTISTFTTIYICIIYYQMIKRITFMPFDCTSKPTLSMSLLVQ